MKIRIPPELMPDDETALHNFDLYFTNVHPYVPVLDKGTFYRQWHSNRESLSPLLLEAVFAIGGRLADEPAQGQQWLALASSMNDLGAIKRSRRWLTGFCRTCGLFHGCSQTQHASSSLDHFEGQRSRA